MAKQTDYQAVMEFFGAKGFVGQWRKLTPIDRQQLETGIVTGTLTY